MIKLPISFKKLAAIAVVIAFAFMFLGGAGLQSIGPSPVKSINIAHSNFGGDDYYTTSISGIIDLEDYIYGSGEEIKSRAVKWSQIKRTDMPSGIIQADDYEVKIYGFEYKWYDGGELKSTQTNTYYIPTMTENTQHRSIELSPASYTPEGETEDREVRVDLVITKLESKIRFGPGGLLTDVETHTDVLLHTFTVMVKAIPEKDTDNDGIPDKDDPDIDGDGINNEEDGDPYDANIGLVEPETFEIKGKVIDQENSLPISEARIYSTDAVAETLTDASGDFTLKVDQKGVHTLSFEKSGYGSRVTELTTEAATNTITLARTTQGGPGEGGEDTDGDGEIEGSGEDTDNDGIVDGEDSDIDGDDIPNQDDPDPYHANGSIITVLVLIAIAVFAIIFFLVPALKPYKFWGVLIAIAMAAIYILSGGF